MDTISPPELDEHEDQDDPNANGEEVTESQGTLLDRLRIRRAEMAEEAASGERTLELPIPGYHNEMFAVFVYRPDAWDKLKKIGKKAQKSKHPRRELHVAQDSLAAAVQDICVSENDGETLEPIDPSGEPTLFDDKLADLLGFEASKAREVITRVFSNDLAAVAMANRVHTWMQGEDEEVDEDF